MTSHSFSIGRPLTGEHAAELNSQTTPCKAASSKLTRIKTRDHCKSRVEHSHRSPDWNSFGHHAGKMGMINIRTATPKSQGILQDGPPKGRSLSAASNRCTSLTRVSAIVADLPKLADITIFFVDQPQTPRPTNPFLVGWGGKFGLRLAGDKLA